MRYHEMPMDETIHGMIETIVIDWLNKYPLEGEGGLSMQNPDNIDNLKAWVAGVWGRITHQLVDSGLPYGNDEILSLARNALYKELSGHRWYENIKPYLPKSAGRR